MNTMAESIFKRKAVAFLKSRGAWVFKVHGDGYSRNGVQDLICCYLGRFLAVELKVDGRDAEPLQSYEASQVKKSRGISIVARTILDIEKALMKIEADYDFANLCITEHLFCDSSHE